MSHAPLGSGSNVVLSDTENRQLAPVTSDWTESKCHMHIMHAALHPRLEKDIVWVTVSKELTQFCGCFFGPLPL